jgi:hypothetical protein
VLKKNPKSKSFKQVNSGKIFIKKASCIGSKPDANAYSLTRSDNQQKALLKTNSSARIHRKLGEQSTPKIYTQPLANFSKAAAEQIKEYHIEKKLTF